MLSRWKTILFVLSGVVVLATAARADILQSSEDGGRLWTSRGGAEVRVHGLEGGEVRVELPPGALVRDLEPTADGWLAAGRIPAGNGSDLLLIEGRGREVDLLPVPAGSGGRYRGQPALMLEDGRLVGLAWAEGDGSRELEMWAAAWNDGEWGAPELVSPKGPGSQLVPSGAVLDDGTWLLVWTAYDGLDDEVLWSRRIGTRWTTPERVHAPNDVFDLSPVVVSTEGGALVAWSWFDGHDYRLKSARWLNGAWSESEPFGGKGSGEPGLIRAGERILLLFPSVEPAVWTVLELDQTGGVRRQAVVSREPYLRPLLVLPEADEAMLRWPDSDYPLEWQDR